MFGMDQATVNSVALAGLSALLAFLSAAFWARRKATKDKAEAVKKTADEMNDKVQELENQLRTLTATFTPISAAFQAVLIKQLTHFHTPELDALLVKVEKNSLSNSEEKKLREGLLARAKDLNGRIDDSEREAALMLPLVMNRVRAGTAVADSEVMVVLVPKEKAK